MKTLITSILFALGMTAAYAQFPGGPGGMQGGDGNGRNRNTGAMQTPALNLEGTAPKGNSKITGFVIDSAATQAVEFANIALYSKATGKAIDGTMADEKGKFTLKSIAVGEYKLMISFIGFKDKTIENLKLPKVKT